MVKCNFHLEKKNNNTKIQTLILHIFRNTQSTCAAGIFAFGRLGFLAT